MTGARARLAALAAAAGYGADALGLIADAALPTRPARGERLGDTDIANIATAVQVLAQAGHPANALPALVAHYRDRYGERCWREQFWQRQLRTASLRYRHPRFYGLSPCEADPARLAGADQSPRALNPRPAAPLARAV
jgi:hypothetical protein